MNNKYIFISIFSFLLITLPYLSNANSADYNSLDVAKIGLFEADNSEYTFPEIQQSESENKQLGNVIPDKYESENSLFVTIIRGFLGLGVLVFIAFIFSTNRKAINWKVVAGGLAIQLLLAIGILKVPFIRVIFEILGKVFVRILDFTKAGTTFLFEGFLDTETYGFIFAFQVLPTIIFFWVRQNLHL
jgi:CNT family concentrative nucleoside transporter